MEQDEKINFWRISATKDLEMMEFLYKQKKFSYALFFGQLGLEKLLKALYIKLKNESPPIYSRPSQIIIKMCLKTT